MTEEKQKEGRSWKLRKAFKTFEKADEFRNEILEEGNFQAKVKVTGEYPNYRYNVRVRETEKFLNKPKKGKGDDSKGQEKVSS